MRFPSFARARRFVARSIASLVGVWVAGILTALLLTALLLLVPLLADLLSTNGALTVPLSARSEVDALKVEPSVVDTKYAHYERCGLLPTVWRLRDSRLGNAATSIYSVVPTLRKNSGALLAIVGLGILLSLLATAAFAWLEISIQRAASVATLTVRRQIHAQSHQLGANDLFIRHKLSSSDLFSIDVETLRESLSLWWRSFPHAATFAVLMFALALLVNFWLAISAVLLVIVGIRLFNIIRQRITARSTILASRSETLKSHLDDYLSQHRLFGNWRTESRNDHSAFDSELQRFESEVLAQRITNAMVRPIALLIVLLGAWIVLALAGINVLREGARLSLADVVILGSTLLALIYPLVCFERLAERLSEAESAASNILTFLDRRPTIGQLPGATTLDRLTRSVAFDHITLADFQGRPLLSEVSCTIPAQRRVAIFCSDDLTPMGIAGLLGRFCDPAAGQVLFDGQDLRAKNIESVRDQVMLLLSGNMIAGGTVLQNITGDETTFSADDVFASLRAARTADFVSSLPDGLNTVVGVNGISLTTGQAIQIGLARAALRNPSVLAIEEPEEALDQKTAEQLAEAIETVSAGKTLIILARRLATLRAAQRVLLFHEGQLVADGTHQELLQQSELYRHLNYVRFNEFRDKFR
jgi:ATP-binding cassette, subfamily B, bacterial